MGLRKVDVRLPGEGNSNSHCARPVYPIITTIKWIRTSRLSIKNSLSLGLRVYDDTLTAVTGARSPLKSRTWFRVWGLGFRV